MLCCALLCRAALCRALPCCAVPCCAVLCSAECRASSRVALPCSHPRVVVVASARSRDAALLISVRMRRWKLRCSLPCVPVWVLLPSHSPAPPVRPSSVPIGTTCFSGSSLTRVSGSRKKYHFDLGGRFTVLVFLFICFCNKSQRYTTTVSHRNSLFLQKPRNSSTWCRRAEAARGCSTSNRRGTCFNFGKERRCVAWRGLARCSHNRLLIQKEPPSCAAVGN